MHRKLLQQHLATYISSKYVNFQFFQFYAISGEDRAKKSLVRAQEIDLSAQFDSNIDFLAPTVFELGKIRDFTLCRSFKRAVPHRNDVIIEKNYIFRISGQNPIMCGPKLF